MLKRTHLKKVADYMNSFRDNGNYFLGNEIHLRLCLRLTVLNRGSHLAFYET